MRHDNSSGSNSNHGSAPGYVEENNITQINEVTTSIEYVVKKSEKIAQALFVLTAHLPPEEPFRHSARTKAMSLINTAFSIKTKSSLQRITLKEIATRHYAEIKAVLDIGVSAGLISAMNNQVLQSEINRVADSVIEIARSHDSTTDHLALQSDFFATAVSKPETKESSGDNFTRDSVTVSNSKHKYSIDTTAKEANKLDSNAQAIRARKRHGRNHSKRRRAILGLFNNNEEITITDVQSVIEGCSQKTMQRELKSMVESGLLEKHGKRRWSSYSLGAGIDLETELINF